MVNASTRFRLASLMMYSVSFGGAVETPRISVGPPNMAGAAHRGVATETRSRHRCKNFSTQVGARLGNAVSNRYFGAGATEVVMLVLLIVLLVLWLILAIVGFAIKGLLWLAIIGIVLFVGTAAIGVVRRRALRR